jgi:hypothetical protein
MQAQFVEPELFTGHYQRNNKAKGRKNLRCYPACRPTGHVDTGYCGRPVSVKVEYDDASNSLELMAFAEFWPRDHVELICG